MICKWVCVIESPFLANLCHLATQKEKNPIQLVQRIFVKNTCKSHQISRIFYFLFIFSEIVDMPSSLPLQHYLKHWQNCFGVSWSYRVEFVLSKCWGIFLKGKMLAREWVHSTYIYFSHSTHYMNVTFHEIICKDVKNILWY